MTARWTADGLERSWQPRHAEPPTVPFWLLMFGAVVVGTLLAGVLLVAQNVVCWLHREAPQDGPAYCSEERPR